MALEGKKWPYTLKRYIEIARSEWIKEIELELTEISGFEANCIELSLKSGGKRVVVCEISSHRIGVALSFNSLSARTAEYRAWERAIEIAERLEKEGFKVVLFDKSMTLAQAKKFLAPCKGTLQRMARGTGVPLSMASLSEKMFLSV